MLLSNRRVFTYLGLPVNSSKTRILERPDTLMRLMSSWQTQHPWTIGSVVHYGEGASNMRVYKQAVVRVYKRVLCPAGP